MFNPMEDNYELIYEGDNCLEDKVELLELIRDLLANVVEDIENNESAPEEGLRMYSESIAWYFEREDFKRVVLELLDLKGWLGELP